MEYFLVKMGTGCAEDCGTDCYPGPGFELTRMIHLSTTGLSIETINAARLTKTQIIED